MPCLPRGWTRTGTYKKIQIRDIHLLKIRAYVCTKLHRYTHTFTARSWIGSSSQNRCSMYRVLGTSCARDHRLPSSHPVWCVHVLLLSSPRVANARIRRGLIGTSRVPWSLSALALACILSEVYCFVCYAVGWDRGCCCYCFWSILVS